MVQPCQVFVSPLAMGLALVTVCDDRWRSDNFRVAPC